MIAGLAQALVLHGAVAAAAPPTIAVQSPRVAECRNPTVSVWLNPRLTSSTDALPTATVANRIVTDPPGTPANVDPDQYPLGSRTITVRACDHASPPNCRTQAVPLTVRDSLPPQIQPGQNRQVQCTSPLGIPAATTYCADDCDGSCNPTAACTGAGGTAASSCTACKSSCVTACLSDTTRVHLDRPVVTDTCDPHPVWASSKLPASYPMGVTTLTVTAGDFTGNVASRSLAVHVVDTVGPHFVATVPSFNVVSHAGGGSGDAAACSTGGVPGTLVTLPAPAATDVCTPAAHIAYAFGLGGVPGDSPNPQMCLPDGVSTVRFVARDAVGNTDTSGTAPNAPTTAQVTVAPAASFGLPITVAPASSSGFVAAGTVAASTSGTSGAISWALVGARAPDAAPAAAASFTVAYSAEGSYCPLYVSVGDAGGNRGAAPPLCFGVDATPPTHSYAGVPTASSYPGGATPAFSSGQLLPLEIAAQDAAGVLQSGVARVKASLLPASGPAVLVYDNTYCTQGPGGAALASCPAQHYVAGCNQVGVAVCSCQARDPTSQECAGDGRLDLTALTAGSYTLQVQVFDLAGNVQAQAYPFAVGDVPLTLGGSAALPNAGIVGMLRLTLAAPSTPVAAASHLQNAIRYLGAAATVGTELPGQAMMLARQAWGELDAAQSSGADVSFATQTLATVVAAEARRGLAALHAAYAAGTLAPWSVLGADPQARGAYATRRFLTHVGGTFRDYLVDPVSTLALGDGLLAIAAQHQARGEAAAAIDASLAALDALATLFNDGIWSQAYNYTTHTLDVGTPGHPHVVPEGYFAQSPATHFGSETAATVNAQIKRFAALAAGGTLFGVSPTAVAALQTVSQQIDGFAAAVSIIQNSNWDIGSTPFTNRRLVTEVYLPAVTALQTLQGLHSAAIHTRAWQVGLGFTLAAVVNFSQYEGPTNLACLLWGQDSDGEGDTIYQGCAALKVPAAPVIFGMNGNTINPLTVDYEAQVAECRYSRMMYALADGRLQDQGQGPGALDLFVSSRCQIIDLYNRYYVPNRYINGDTLIDPTLYGCAATATAFTAAQAVAECGGCAVGGAAVADTVCDGIDSDCNGLVDDAVASTACGCPGLAAGYVCPCAASSACINGQPLDCVPGVPATHVDTLCNGRDNACTGHPAAGYVPTQCGVGGCRSSSACVAGNEVACTPLAPQAETCNGRDDNCNIAVDEGLDNDGDSYGCPPCALYATQAACQAQLGCSYTGGVCQGRVTCTQCIPGQSGCSTSLLCAGDLTGSGAWSGAWDCDDTDPEVYPGHPEICDGKDNNCNGSIDEGVLNACGTCDPACTATVYGAGGTPFSPNPDNAANIAQDGNTGSLGLSTQNLNLQYAWVANDTAGTVSKLDMTTGREVGRFCQALKTGVTTFVRAGGRDPTGATYDTRAEPTVCAGCGGCNNGSRTAVDTDGNMYIANRAYSGSGYVGTYSKVAGNLNGCVDVNGDGVIQTSRDVNGDGVIDPNQALPPAQREYWGELDECILWTRKPVTWDRARQPSCNTPGWPPNNAATDPQDTSFADEQAACVNDPNSDPGICQWTNACTGSGDTTCAANGTAAQCSARPGCAWGSVCTGASYCSSLSAASCGAYSACRLGTGCAPVSCASLNSDRGRCRAISGCSWYQDCYNIGDGPLQNVAMTMPRSMSIDARGDAWVGLYNRRGFMQVNTTNGYVKRWAYTGYQPYGSSLDRNGILWHGDSCCGSQVIAGLNTNPTTVVYTNPDTGNPSFTWPPYGTQVSGSRSPGGSYGIATDNRGYVYLGSYGTLAAAAFRFDARRNSWTTIPSSKDASGNVLPNAGYGRGTAVDAAGTIWVAQMGYGTGGRVTGFDPNTLKPTLDVNMGTAGNIPIGIGVGYAGRIWTSNQASYNVTVIDPTTGSASYYPVGGPPYCYSDFTGAVLRTFISPQGTYSEVVDACYGFPVSRFFSLTWAGILPVGTQDQGRSAQTTRLRFRVRGTAQLVTQDAQGNAVDPLAASQWTLWYPDDVTDPSKNSSDATRVYYYESAPGTPAPSSGACVGRVQAALDAAHNTYSVAGCADLAAVPISAPFSAGGSPQNIAYLQVEALLVADADNTVQPTLDSVELARLCPQQ